MKKLKEKKKEYGKPCPKCGATLTNLGCSVCLEAMKTYAKKSQK